MVDEWPANKKTQTVTIVAFDFGLRHIGVAVGQTVTGTATPVDTVPANQGKPNWHRIAELISEWRPDRLIVGLPLNMDATESDMSARARKFADRLQGRAGLPVSLVDERLTSFEASGLAAGRAGPAGPAGPAGRTAANDEKSHAIAARLIAESWLATHD